MCNDYVIRAQLYCLTRIRWKAVRESMLGGAFGVLEDEQSETVSSKRKTYRKYGTKLEYLICTEDAMDCYPQTLLAM